MPGYFCKGKSKNDGKLPNCTGVCVQVIEMGEDGNPHSMGKRTRLEACVLLGFEITEKELNPEPENIHTGQHHLLTA